MSSYHWTQLLRPLYDKAVALYTQGNRDLVSYFSVEETSFLTSIGLRPINLYDYAEDLVKYGEPDWETVALLASARRDYFLYHQQGITKSAATDSSELPAKTAELDGIAWLPRIIAKATCFLEGGLCLDIMYNCGGDRRFLKEHDIHPADFLRVVWASNRDQGKILAFVRKEKI